jgi:hypothetical protein
VSSNASLGVFTRRIGRWRITFAFGLIHGFVGALREIGLPITAVMTAKIGVDIGQVAVVSIVGAHRPRPDQLTAVDSTKRVRAAARSMCCQG